MIYTIENDYLKCGIDMHGAEVKSLIRKADGREMMWCGDPVYWGRTSPVLFPFVGTVKNKTYRYDGKTYTIGQHGFARDMDFTMESQTNTEIWFRLTESEDTLTVYPFRFVLRIGYRLEESILRVMWEVNNPSEKELWFSIGAHPAFAIPSFQGHSLRLFNQKGKPLKKLENRVFGKDGCVSYQFDEILIKDGYLPLTESLFDGDALVMEECQLGRVDLLNEDRNMLVSLSFDAPVVGIWSPPHKNAPFVCIEPWYGRCDAEEYDGDLNERDYECMITDGDCFKAEYTINVGI